ncbi:MAG: hypothetical protein LBJ19_01600 [Holosporaceae bacterium]|jgi:hypothetical protein|nr:hypothetical protein [Holosporaceae bacterium]
MKKIVVCAAFLLLCFGSYATEPSANTSCVPGGMAPIDSSGILNNSADEDLFFYFGIGTALRQAGESVFYQKGANQPAPGGFYETNRDTTRIGATVTIGARYKLIDDLAIGLEVGSDFTSNQYDVNTGKIYNNAHYDITTKRSGITPRALILLSCSCSPTLSLFVGAGGSYTKSQENYNGYYPAGSIGLIYDATGAPTNLPLQDDVPRTAKGMSITSVCPMLVLGAEKKLANWSVRIEGEYLFDKSKEHKFSSTPAPLVSVAPLTAAINTGTPGLLFVDQDLGAAIKFTQKAAITLRCMATCRIPASCCSL